MRRGAEWHEGSGLPALLYRHFARDGALLYVGSTVSLPERNDQHSVGSPWFDETVRIEAFVYGCIRLAREAEEQAIRTEFPRWNITHRSTNHPDGPARSWWDVAAIHPGAPHPERVTKPHRRYVRAVA